MALDMDRRELFEAARNDATAWVGAWISAVTSADWETAADALYVELLADDDRDLRALNTASILAAMAEPALKAHGLKVPDAEQLTKAGRTVFARDMLAQALIIDRSLIHAFPGDLAGQLLPVLTVYAAQGCQVVGSGDQAAGLRRFLLAQSPDL